MLEHSIKKDNGQVNAKIFFFATSFLYNRKNLIDIGQHLAPFHDRTREPVFFPP